MADGYNRLPSDSGNLGNKVRTQSRTVGSDTVVEGYTHSIADYRVYSDQTLLVKVAHLNVATSGDHDLIAAVASKKLRVHSITVSVNAANNITFKDDTPTTLCIYYFGANGGIEGERRNSWYFETAAGKKLVANFSAASDVDITVGYCEV